MKTKGISFWEQYVHLLVIGVALLICGAFVAMQFLTQPNAVKGTGQNAREILPGEVDGMLEDAAGDLKRQFDENRVPPDLKEKFAKVKGGTSDQVIALIDQSTTPGPTLAMPRPPFTPALDAGVVVKSGKPFVVPTIPAPSMLASEQYFDTLADEELTKNAALGSLFPTKPYDVTWVTAAATVDVAGILNQYKTAGPNGELAIPPIWFNNRLDIFDVKVEREEMGPDGQWTNLTLLEPIPGQTTIRAELVPNIGKPARDQIVARFGKNSIQMDIVQPEFYATRNASWIAPEPPGTESGVEETAVIDPTQREIAELRKDIAKWNKQLEIQRQLLKDNGCPENPEPEAPKEEPDQGGDKPGGPGLGGGQVGGRNPNQDDRNKAKCDSIRKKISRFEKLIANAEEKLADLLPPAEDPRKALLPKKEEPAATAPVDQLRIWAHDMGVEPGKTYRYRFIVEVYNPFFAHKMELIDEQDALAEKITLASQTSEWTVPLTVTPPMLLWVTSATPEMRNVGGGGATMGQVSAEVFRFSDGRWWSQQFTVQPGDRIGSKEDVIVTKAQAAPKPDNKPEAPGGDKPRGPGLAAGGGGGGGGGGAGAAKPPKPDAPKGTPAVKAEIDFSTDWFVLAIVHDITATTEEGKENRAAQVILQSLSTPERTMTVWPRTQYRDPDLRELRQEVALAES